MEDLGHPDAEVLNAVRLQRSDCPVSIESISILLWPEIDPSHPASHRAVKAAVRRLRRAGHKIGSSRGGRDKNTGRVIPPGYYMISTPAELASTVAPMLRQALDELKTIEALTGKGYYVQEISGQAKLDFGAEAAG